MKNNGWKLRTRGGRFEYYTKEDLVLYMHREVIAATSAQLGDSHFCNANDARYELGVRGWKVYPDWSVEEA